MICLLMNPVLFDIVAHDIWVVMTIAPTVFQMCRQIPLSGYCAALYRRPNTNLHMHRLWILQYVMRSFVKSLLAETRQHMRIPRT